MGAARGGGRRCALAPPRCARSGQKGRTTAAPATALSLLSPFFLSSPPPPVFFQEDFEAALASHRATWQAEFDAQRAALEKSFADQRAALAAEVEEKARERRAIKNMAVSLVFILRLLM